MEMRIIDGWATVSIPDQKRAEDIKRRNAISLFMVALQEAGAPLESYELLETGYGDRLVKVRLTGGKERVANITADSTPTAIWDILRQVPELRERG